MADLPQTGDDARGDQTLELYKIFVDSMEKAVARRQTVNSFFLSANSLLVAIMGLLGKFGLEDRHTLIPLAPLAAVGVLICCNWKSIIQNYRTLNGAKFDVIHQLEDKLSDQPFADEWKQLDGDGGRHKPISGQEENVATAFIGVYVALLAFAVWAYFWLANSPAATGS